MTLDKDLVKQFAAVMAPASKEKSKEKSDGKVYGTISKVETEDDKEITYVELDGSGLETPVDGSVVCAVGDRVLVQIRNHKAYISDNFTAPPNGRATDKFYYFDNNRGMIIGRLNPTTHEPEGNYVLITDTDYQICNEDDEVLAMFGDTQSVIGLETEKHIRMTPTGGYEIFDGDDLLAVFDGSQVRLGDNSSNAKIYFCDKNGTISYSNDTLVIEGADATGIRSIKPGDNNASSQVAVAANDNQLAAAMSILNASGTVNGQVAIEHEAGVGTHVVLKGADLSFNSNTVLASNNLIRVGTVTIRKNVPYWKAVRFSTTIGSTYLNGYKLAGLRRVTCNHPNSCSIRSFGVNPTTNEVYAYVINRSKKSTEQPTYTVTVTLVWFAFNATSSGADPINIPLPSGETDHGDTDDE